MERAMSSFSEWVEVCHGCLLGKEILALGATVEVSYGKPHTEWKEARP